MVQLGWRFLTQMTLFSSYFVPAVVLGVAVGPGRRSVVRLAINSSLEILNEDAKDESLLICCPLIREKPKQAISTGIIQITSTAVNKG